MTRKEDWDSTVVSHPRMNGLKAMAAREDRSVAKQIEWILKNAGVPELTDKELEQQLRLIKQEETLVARK